jgi:hypothetical protein
MKLIAVTLLLSALLSIASAQENPDGLTIPDESGHMEYLTAAEAAAIHAGFTGIVTHDEDFYDNPMWVEGDVDRTGERTGDVSQGTIGGGTIGGTDLVPQAPAPGLDMPTHNFVRKIAPSMCGSRTRLGGSRGGAGGQARGCGRNLRGRAPK